MRGWIGVQLDLQDEENDLVRLTRKLHSRMDKTADRTTMNGGTGIRTTLNQTFMMNTP